MVLARRRAWLVAWLLVLVPAVAMVVASWNAPVPFEIGDHAQYLLHARALQEGRSYADTGYLFTPLCRYVGPPSYPPGLPLTVVAFQAVAGPSPLLLRLFFLAFLFAFILLAGTYFAVHGEPWLGLGVTLFLGLSCPFAPVRGLVLSDLPFAALVWAVIWLYDAPGEMGPGRAAAATLLAVTAISYREVGVALVPPMLLFGLLAARRRRWAPMLPAAALVAGLIAATALRPAMVSGLGRAALNTVNELHRVLRLLRYRTAIFEAHLYPFDSNLANDAYHVVSGLLMLIGLGLFLVRARRRFVVAFAATYAVVLALAPILSGRYLWPLYPLLGYGFLAGLDRLIGWLRRDRPEAWRGRTAFAIAAVLALASLSFHRCEEPGLASLGNPDLQDLFRHLRSLAAGGPVRAAFVNPRLLTLETRIPAMALCVRTDDALLAEMSRQGVTHAIDGDLGVDVAATATLRRHIVTTPERFVAEYRNPSFVVYRLRAGGAAGE